MSDLVHCIYSSVQARVLTPAEIDELLFQSRTNNQQRGITGILLHVGLNFFQVLEGPSQAVDNLYANILIDTRHVRATQIIYEPIPRRFFGEFSMSLATLSPRELGLALEEITPEATEGLLSDLDEGRAKRLLRAFAQGRWRVRLDARLAEGDGLACSKSITQS